MNFDSRAFIGGVPFRPTEEGPYEISATVVVPANHQLTSADRLRLLKIGANMRLLEVTVMAQDLDSNVTPTLTLDAGYYLDVGTDDPNAFLSASTIGQAGGQARVENGGDDPFAVGVLGPQTETLDIVVTPVASAATAATVDRFVTVTVRAVQDVFETPDPLQPPYIYSDRYDTEGVSSV